MDLQLRGPGDLLGTRQSGIPEFRYVNLVTDGELISRARHAAHRLLERDPELRHAEHLALRRLLRERFGADARFLDIA